MITINESDLLTVAFKFDTLRKMHQNIIEPVTMGDLRKVADYLFEPKYEDPDTWYCIANGTVYSYSIFLHEKFELEYLDRLIESQVINNYKDGRRTDAKTGAWRNAHGKGLFEQYKLLRRYIFDKTGIEYKLVHICANDMWEGSDIDHTNAKRLKKYIKKFESVWYNEYRENYQYDATLAALLKSIREDKGVEWNEINNSLP